MYTYKYILDGVSHEIVSQSPIPHVNPDNTIIISANQNKVANQLKTLVRAWIELSAKNNITWWCGAGTLLGAIRDKGLIHYDDDIDFYFHFDNYERINKMICGDEYEIAVCEQGFQFHKKGIKYPFIDLWVLAPNPNNITQLILAGPIINNKPSYIADIMWPSDITDITDICELEEVPFEDLNVFVPRNSIKHCQKLYGNDCLTRYVIMQHTDMHEKVDILPNPYLRMLFMEFSSRIDPAPTVVGKIIPMIGALVSNQLITSDKNKMKRHVQIIKRHIKERYFGAPSPYGV